MLDSLRNIRKMSSWNLLLECNILDSNNTYLNGYHIDWSTRVPNACLDVAECVRCVHPVAEDWAGEGRKEGQRVNKGPLLQKEEFISLTIWWLNFISYGDRSCPVTLFHFHSSTRV